MDVEVDLFGEPLVRRSLLRRAAGMTNHREAFRRIARILENAMRRNFATQGVYGGARWRDLAPSTIATKRRSKDAATRANARTVLMATGALAESLTTSGAGHVEEMTDDTLRWGSLVPYGVFHQSRKPRTKIPHRPLRLAAVDRRDVVREVQRSMMGAA